MEQRYILSLQTGSLTERQTTIDQHTCLRTYGNDKILIRLRPTEGSKIRVAPFFRDGEKVCELYSGQTATVSHGVITLERYSNSIAIFCPLNTSR